MIIGISGFARSGKDTLFSLLKGHFIPSCIRVALADEIKKDLKLLLEKNFNIDPFDCSEYHKSVIRPLLVSYGTDVGRTLNKNHWINKIRKQLEENESNNIVSVITDIRYENEFHFLKENFSESFFVNVEREGFGPANEEESKNTPILKNLSDHIINWPSFKVDISEGIPHVENLYKKIKKIR